MTGSARRGVVNFLVGRRTRRWVPRHRIVRACPAPASAVDKALPALVSIGHLESRPDPKDGRRRPYRIRKGA